MLGEVHWIQQIFAVTLQVVNQKSEKSTTSVW